MKTAALAILGALLITACSDRPLAYPPEWPDAAAAAMDASEIEPVEDCPGTLVTFAERSAYCTGTGGCCAQSNECHSGAVCLLGVGVGGSLGICCKPSPRWFDERADAGDRP